MQRSLAYLLFTYIFLFVGHLWAHSLPVTHPSQLDFAVCSIQRGIMPKEGSVINPASSTTHPIMEKIFQPACVALMAEKISKVPGKNVLEKARRSALKDHGMEEEEIKPFLAGHITSTLVQEAIFTGLQMEDRPDAIWDITHISPIQHALFEYLTLKHMSRSEIEQSALSYKERMHRTFIQFNADVAHTNFLNGIEATEQCNSQHCDYLRPLFLKYGPYMSEPLFFHIWGPLLKNWIISYPNIFNIFQKTVFGSTEKPTDYERALAKIFGISTSGRPRRSLLASAIEVVGIRHSDCAMVIPSEETMLTRLSQME
jgi:hypothetical protein